MHQIPDNSNWGPVAFEPYSSSPALTVRESKQVLTTTSTVATSSKNWEEALGSNFKSRLYVSENFEQLNFLL